MGDLTFETIRSRNHKLLLLEGDEIPVGLVDGCHFVLTSAREFTVEFSCIPLVLTSIEIYY